jgi:5'-3' exoribonuclease 2
MRTHLSLLFLFRNKSLLVTTLPASFRPNFSFRRPDSSTNKSVEAKVQSDETQNVNSSTRMSSVSQKSDRDYDETKQETATSSIPNRQEEQNDPDDTIRLWEGGWHERYYKSKFKEDQNNLDNIRMQVVQHYIQGLCWVLQYYYQGVPSWDW